MTGIIERLRSSSPYLHGSSAERTMAEAATEIAELRAEVERLKEQLASLQALSGYEVSIMQLEIEKLRLLLRRHQVAAWCEEDDLAVETRAVLEDKPRPWASYTSCGSCKRRPALSSTTLLPPSALCHHVPARNPY